jgi:lipoyl(octanoyl) transferase
VLKAIGAEVRKTNRGGDVTYHGPGQTVAYPLLSLRLLRDANGKTLGARRYVETLEDVMLDVCHSFGVRDAYGRVPLKTGVWVGEKKIGAVGVQIRGGVTTHGLAFNRDPDLSFFNHIVSCGLPDAKPTSLADEVARLGGSGVGRRVRAARAEVEAKLVQAFVSRFLYDDVSVHRE